MYCKKIFYFFILGLILLFFGCAPTRTILIRDYPVLDGFYHRVQAKETLWGISQIYGVSVDAIVEANRIPNAAYIEENQLLLIPGVKDKFLSDVKQEILKDEFFQWPLRGRVVSYFNDRKSLWVNRGIHIRSASSNVVYPARSGDVVFADFLSGYGYTVIIDHRDGYNTVYGHNEEILVNIGSFVGKDTPIAKIGGSDRLAFLHFEIRKNTIAQNPLHYLP